MNAWQLDHHEAGAPSAEPGDTPKFPAARYFQIHFEHLYALIGDLKCQLDQANHQIEILRQMQGQERREMEPRMPHMVRGPHRRI